MKRTLISIALLVLLLVPVLSQDPRPKFTEPLRITTPDGTIDVRNVRWLKLPNSSATNDGGIVTISFPVSAIQNAAADGTTKGVAAFVAADFNAVSGVISLDYTNGQAASGSTKGFLNSTDWSTFNNKVSSQWTTSGSNIYYTAGGVGIGTSVPKQSNGLHLAYSSGSPFGFVTSDHNMTFSSNAYFDGTDWRYTTANKAAQVIVGRNGNIFLRNTNTTGSADGTITWATPLYIDPTGTVGIGTTTPGRELTVNGGVQLSTATAKPTCNSSNRGTFWAVASGAGVKDTVEVCAKDAADAYAWRTIY